MQIRQELSKQALNQVTDCANIDCVRIRVLSKVSLV